MNGDDLIGLLNHPGVTLAVVGGISMGAGVALNVAVRFPERVAGLVLSRTAWLDAPMADNTIALFAYLAHLLRSLGVSATTGAGIDWAVRELEQEPGFATIAEHYPDAASSSRSQLTSQRALDGVARLERLPRDQPIARLRDAASIHVPALVVAHHQDPIHRFEFGVTVARSIPDAHFAHVTSKSVDTRRRADEVQDALTSFLRQLLVSPINLGAPSAPARQLFGLAAGPVHGTQRSIA